MSEVALAALSEVNENECKDVKKPLLKGLSKDYMVSLFEETESASEGVSRFLSTINEEQPPQELTFEATHITPEEIELQEEIEQMQVRLEVEGDEEISKETRWTEKDPEKSLEKSFEKRLEKTPEKYFEKSSGKFSKMYSKKSTDRSSGKNTERYSEKSSERSPVVSREAEPQKKMVRPPFFPEPKARLTPEGPKERPQRQQTYSSLFSLARSFSKTKAPALPKADVRLSKDEGKKEERKSLGVARQVEMNDPHSSLHTMDEKEGERGRDHDSNQDQGAFDDEEQKKKKQDYFAKKPSVKDQRRICAVDTGQSVPSPAPQEKTTPGMGNIYLEFMALMGRVLGQSEADAHSLYKRIKERTDQVDVLTHLIGQVNATNGALDWEKNEEMKLLIDKAREIGVDIAEGKYKWSEDEKRMLKENIQMRKDSMEKMTQLERTDMQRFLQESSQCHQARSNVLKLLKEVIDTIIYNMRP